jgi:hypothetical protein
VPLIQAAATLHHSLESSPYTSYLFNLCTKIIIICQYQILKHEKINTGNK